jgi:hypothetical protein
MNEERIPKKDLSMKVQGKILGVRPRSRCKQQIRNEATQME